MKGFVGVTQEEDPYLIGLLLMDTGGQAYKRRHRNISRNVINVKDSRRIFTSLEEFLIIFLALGHLLNRVQILWDFFLKPQEIKSTYQFVQTTKWVEAESLANIRDVDVKRFIWKNIITRFRVPYALISDNGFQFDSKPLGNTVLIWV